jgi:hypothetical protein
MFGIFASAPRLTTSRAFKAEDTRERELSFKCECRQGSSICTADGRDLSRTNWTLSIKEASEYSEEASLLEAIGFITYYSGARGRVDPDNEICQVSFFLEPRDFESLVSACRAKSEAIHFSINADGMEVGWQPDGSGSEWDVVKHPKIPIVYMQFQIDLSPPQSISNRNFSAG